MSLSSYSAVKQHNMDQLLCLKHQLWTAFIAATNSHSKDALQAIPRLIPGPSEDNTQQCIMGHKYYPKFVELCSFFTAKISLFLSPHSLLGTVKYRCMNIGYHISQAAEFCIVGVSSVQDLYHAIPQAPTLLENMWTPAMKKPLWSSRVTHTNCM
jgi:hypothetical protein